MLLLLLLLLRCVNACVPQVLHQVQGFSFFCFSLFVFLNIPILNSQPTLVVKPQMTDRPPCQVPWGAF